MNPFTLPGPQFLVFYALFAAAVLVALYLARRCNESGRLPNLETKDPYLFACLRGGPAEVIRIATLGLADRGLLQVSGGTVRISSGVGAATGWSGIEKQILDYFTKPSTIDAAVKDTRLLDYVSTTYEARLRSHRLVPNPIVKRTRHSYLAAAILALWMVGGIKFWIAWMAGRSNVVFLVVLMIVAAIAAVNIANPYRTSLGSAYLRSLRGLFSQLRATAPPASGQAADRATFCGSPPCMALRRCRSVRSPSLATCGRNGEARTVDRRVAAGAAAVVGAEAAAAVAVEEADAGRSRRPGLAAGACGRDF